MNNRGSGSFSVAVVGVLFVTIVSVWAFRSAPLLPKEKQGQLSWFSSLLSSASTNSNQQHPTRLPPDLVKYSQVPKEGKPKFTANTIPKGLLKDHTTKAGTWGLICVSQGTLEYTILEPQRTVFRLTADTPPGVVVPQNLHHVKALTDDVEFVVEFYRLPGTGPVDEKREGL